MDLHDPTNHVQSTGQLPHLSRLHMHDSQTDEEYYLFMEEYLHMSTYQSGSYNWDADRLQSRCHPMTKHIIIIEANRNDDQRGRDRDMDGGCVWSNMGRSLSQPCHPPHTHRWLISRSCRWSPSMQWGEGAHHIHPLSLPMTSAPCLWTHPTSMCHAMKCNIWMSASVTDSYLILQGVPCCHSPACALTQDTLTLNP